jgi:hypothetical protein
MNGGRGGTSGAFMSSARVTAALLKRGELRLPARFVGRQLSFADGTTSRIYRETVVQSAQVLRPTLLVVCFQLRLLRRSRVMHALFRLESIANTPLFAGFDGFRSKLWATDLRTGIYRGVYEWDDAGMAEAYVTTLARLLRPICIPGSVRYHIEPGIRRDDFLRHPAIVDPDPAIGAASAEDRWWRLATPVKQ